MFTPDAEIAEEFSFDPIGRPSFTKVSEGETSYMNLFGPGPRFNLSAEALA